MRDARWEVHLTHWFREANKVADTLANIGVNLNVPCMLFRQPPREVMDALFADAVGVEWPRKIRS